MRLELREPGLDIAEPGQFVLHRALDLGFAQGEHPPHFIGRGVLVEQSGHLVQGQTEFFEHQNAIQARQLVGAVRAIARLWVGKVGAKETDLVVIAQQTTGDLGNP